MNNRLASRARPPRQPWPAIDDDDDQAPIEEWALDEVDSEFALPSGFGQRALDASFD